ncbi:ABC transporter permease [Roseisalinus antarcticus]|uniref:D-allose transport system permease protein AlsC n=1 Tax=Roseisalinus antarcticus TaxID=254357 RepID=A0A1Y5TEH2_9RHOB|nr:ABC transporter permease [Roseisalinus antarcticus]SLN62053.1 D-allose transport system permease protein AlsC [Roseisalinus antarcticus]
MEFQLQRKSKTRAFRNFLHRYPTVIPAVTLAIAVGLFALIVGERFFSPFNLTLVMQQVTIIGLLGIAQTLVILTAGIDLSVGVIMILSSVVMGRVSVTYGLPVELALFLGLATGFLCGLFNGLLVALIRLPPFIVTLGTWSVYGAIIYLVSRSETIRAQQIEDTAPFLQWTGNMIRLEGGAVITYGTILLLVVAAAVWYLLNRSSYGRHIYATGDEPDAARLAGIKTARTLIFVYVLCGVLCALAGWVLIGRIGAVSPLGNQTANLDAITAVVIGGTSLFGGRGSIIGTLMGALIVGVFRNGLALAGLDVLWQEFSVGLLIIAAVTIDQWVRKMSA